MKRREFIRLVGGSVAAWPLAARAQQQPQGMRRVGILMTLPQNDPETQRRVAAFVQGLRGLGWTEGARVRIDYRWPGSDVDRVRTAAGLLDLKPDAILAETSLAVAPLQRLTSTVPIVFVQFTDPVGSGAVSTLARPGGNITGFTPNEFSATAKMLEVLREVAPQVSQVYPERVLGHCQDA